MRKEKDINGKSEEIIGSEPLGIPNPYDLKKLKNLIAGPINHEDEEASRELGHQASLIYTTIARPQLFEQSLVRVGHSYRKVACNQKTNRWTHEFYFSETGNAKKSARCGSRPLLREMISRADNFRRRKASGHYLAEKAKDELHASMRLIAGFYIPRRDYIEPDPDEPFPVIFHPATLAHVAGYRADNDVKEMLRIDAGHPMPAWLAPTHNENQIKHQPSYIRVFQDIPQILAPALDGKRVADVIEIPTTLDKRELEAWNSLVIAKALHMRENRRETPAKGFKLIMEPARQFVRDPYPTDKFPNQQIAWNQLASIAETI